MLYHGDDVYYILDSSNKLVTDQSFDEVGIVCNGGVKVRIGDDYKILELEDEY